MSTQLNNRLNWKPNYLAIGIVLGVCFIAAMENQVFLVIDLITGINQDRRHRETHLKHYKMGANE